MDYKIELKNISEIKPNANNPRIIKNDKYKKLLKSIKEFPEMLKLRPIVIDELGQVLGGNMRFKACKEAGLTQVPTIMANQLTEEQKKEFIIKDNANFGDWDWDILVENSDWNLKDIADWGIDVPKFDDDSEDEDVDDRNINIDNLYQITIDFKNEEELKEAYDRLLLLGFDCKILQL